MNSGFEIDDQNRAGNIDAGPSGASPAGGDQFDFRSVAVRHAEAGAEAWRAALRAQQSAPPDHTDFYNLTRELMLTLAPLDDLMRVVSEQVAGYADSLPPADRVYDDERRDDPRELLTTASRLMAAIAVQVTASALEINRFWSLIGRIGVEHVQPQQARPEPAEDETGGAL